MDLASIEWPALYRRTAGRGPLVVCLHASGSSSSQWDPLLAELEDRFQCVAFDLHGHGRSPAPGSPPYRLATESEAVLRAIAAATAPVHVVGHSYGGAVALDVALRLGAAVASVTVYEPVLFGVLARDSEDYREITSVGRSILEHVAAGRMEQACARFVDYWGGAGAWDAIPPNAQPRIAARMVIVAQHFDALFADPLPLARLHELRVPVRVLHGETSPSPALAVTRRLALSRGFAVERVPGAGHMGPVTHARDVTARIAAHLDAHIAARSLRAA